MVKKSGRSLAGLGNTVKPRCVESKNKYSKYCFTFNNYTEQEYENIIEWSKGHCFKYVIGKEIGESGTPHLQGYFELNKGVRMRITEFKKIPCLYKCRFASCNGNENHNVNYCSKDDKDCVASNNINIEEELKIITELYPWQSELEDIILNCKDGRKIHWIYEKEGGVGKTEFVKYMVARHCCLLCGGGKKNDVINLVYNNKDYMKRRGLKVVLFNITRYTKNCISYAELEYIKDGIIINNKFETGSFICNRPTVAIFANSLPKIDKMSYDKWNILEIKDEKELVKIDVLAIVKKNKNKLKKLEVENSDDDFI